MENNIQNTSNVNLIMIDEKLYRERLNEILKLEIEYERLNRMNLELSIELLLSYGDPVQVQSSRIPNKRFRQRTMFRNARRTCFEDGFGYVEGIVTNKETKWTFAHAWNVDANGNHVDMTIKDPENYSYLGIQIPEILIYEVGYKNGGKWGFNLPFLTVNEN